ncbi:MAG: hypothetical protein ACSLE9_04635 [Burkholderiaceae bacterium]
MPLASKVQAWVWILIYTGLILLGLGLSVQRSDAALGWGLVMVGLAGIAIGGVLVWVRSRMKN